jgi:AGCS family alanine or glycine:cation symporter
LIFKAAFTGRAAAGGAMGLVVAEVIKTGVKRAAFSNEAGTGTAPMAHSNVKTSEPISEGLVAMVGPFIDTIIICTMTALVILVSVEPETYVGKDGVRGVLLTKQAITSNFPTFGRYFLGIAVLLFSTSSMLGFANYVQKCWNFVFKGRKGFGNRTFIILYAVGVVMGSITEATDLINLLDIMFALMILPNMLTTIILAPKVNNALKEYWHRYPWSM